MQIIQKLKLLAKLTITNIFIVPFISYLISHVSILLTRPLITKHKLIPTYSKGILKYQTKIKTKHRIFVNMKIPETNKNMERLGFNLKNNISEKPVFIQLKYKSKTHLILDSVLMYLFTKLNLYCQEQKIKQEIINLNGNQDASFEIKNMKISEFQLEEVLECGWVGMFIYEHDLLIFCVIYLIFFFLLMVFSFYFLIVICRKCDTVTDEEVQEYIGNQIVE